MRRSPFVPPSVNRGSARSLVLRRARRTARSISCSVAGSVAAPRSRSRSTRSYARSSSGCSARRARWSRYAAHAAGHRVGALRLGRTVLPPGHPDARDEPAQVPLPRPGVGLVEVVEVEDEVALRGGVEPEVAQVGVAADHGQDAGRGQPGEVLRHDRRRAAQEGERGRRHPSDPHRDQPLDPALVGGQHEVDGVGPAAAGLPPAQRRPRRALPQPAAECVPLGARGGRSGAGRRTPPASVASQDEVCGRDRHVASDSTLPGSAPSGSQQAILQRPAEAQVSRPVRSSLPLPSRHPPRRRPAPRAA